MTDLRPIDIDDHDDGLLRDAFRSVRERYDGANEESDATLRRALVHTRLQDRRRRFTRWVVLPIAAVLAASTAWAAGTGRLPGLSSVVESFHAEREPSKTGPARVATKPAETTPAPPESIAALPAPAPEPAPLETTTPFTPQAPAPSGGSIAIAPSHAAPAWRPSTSANANANTAPSANSASIAGNSAPTAETPQPPPALSSDPNGQLFAEAHRIHFAERDPARALGAWDRYLDAAPAGRFVPEARYNRAIALVRLGRRDEAKKELAAFANGSYGSYRREEARALLEALDRAP